MNAAAFDTTAEADLVDALRTDPAWLPGLSWVATSGNGEEVVGYALLTRCRVGGEDALALAPVAVLPEYQRRGVGDAVIRALLDEARRRDGERLVVVLGHPEYYPKFGFARASVQGIRAPFEVPDEALMALPLRDGPVPTGVISYPPPFGI